MSENNSSIGSRLKELRKKKGWSQTELANIGGVAKSSQVNYEKHGRMPDAEYLCRLSSQEGVDIQYIITGVKVKYTKYNIGNEADFFDNDFDSKQVLSAVLQAVSAFEELDLKSTKRQVLILADYALKNNSSHDDLVAWLKTTYAMAGVEV